MSATSHIAAATEPHTYEESIRHHYDSLSYWYRLFWGNHLHHGWFNNGTERPREAQIEMLRQCASLLRIPAGARALDVGCGYGGTSLFLASEFGCEVDGLNVSPNQLRVARNKVAAARLGARVSLRLRDADAFPYPLDFYDLVWTMESSEHFADKRKYFHQVRRTLRRNGQLLVAAWTGSMTSYSVRSVASHFLCPAICTAEEYLDLIETTGMQAQKLVDATRYVQPTWQICLRRVRQFAFLKHFVPKDVRSFADGLQIILDAYLSGDLTYTIIAARSR
jgi:tocopherol O-methyltransferase